MLVVATRASSSCAIADASIKRISINNLLPLFVNARMQREGFELIPIRPLPRETVEKILHFY